MRYHLMEDQPAICGKRIHCVGEDVERRPGFVGVGSVQLSRDDVKDQERMSCACQNESPVAAVKPTHARPL